MITGDTLFKETREMFNARVPVEEVSCTRFYMWLPEMEKEDTTWGELSDGIRKQKECQAWSISVLKLFYDELSIDYRKEFLENITNPVSALCLYLRLEHLTDEDDVILEAKFKGKLPRAEAGLADGTVVRVKE